MIDSTEFCRCNHCFDVYVHERKSPRLSIVMPQKHSVTVSQSIHAVYVPKIEMCFSMQALARPLISKPDGRSAWLGFKLGKAMDIKVGLRLL